MLLISIALYFDTNFFPDLNSAEILSNFLESKLLTLISLTKVNFCCERQKLELITNRIIITKYLYDGKIVGKWVATSQENEKILEEKIRDLLQ